MGKLKLLIFLAHLAELEVQKYLPIFPYWPRGNREGSGGAVQNVSGVAKDKNLDWLLIYFFEMHQ